MRKFAWAEVYLLARRSWASLVYHEFLVGTCYMFMVKSWRLEACHWTYLIQSLLIWRILFILDLNFWLSKSLSSLILLSFLNGCCFQRFVFSFFLTFNISKLILDSHSEWWGHTLIAASSNNKPWFWGHILLHNFLIVLSRDHRSHCLYNLFIQAKRWCAFILV